MDLWKKDYFNLHYHQSVNTCICGYVHFFEEKTLTWNELMNHLCSNIDNNISNTSSQYIKDKKYVLGFMKIELLELTLSPK